MNKLFLIFLTILSLFILISTILSNSYVSFFFLPIPVYFIATLLTNSDDFSWAKHKKAAFFYFGIILILALFSIFRFI